MKSAVCNNRLISESEAVVPVSIREVFFNFGVYESVKVLRGTAVFLEDHLERLLDSARLLEIPQPYSSDEIFSMVYRLIDADRIGRATMRIQLIGGTKPMLFIYYTDLPAYPAEYYTKGVPLIIYPGERVMPEVKSTSLLLNYVALREAERQGAFEALFEDRRGCSIEGTRSNLFAVRGRTLITAREGVLAGVTRKHIIEHARDIGLEVSYQCVTTDELTSGSFDELFISSTSMGAIPVKQVGSSSIGSAFPVTLTIHTLVRNLECGYVRSAENRT